MLGRTSNFQVLCDHSKILFNSTFHLNFVWLKSRNFSKTSVGSFDVSITIFGLVEE